MKKLTKKLIRRMLFCYMLKGFIRYIVGISFDKNDEFTKHKQFILVGNHNSHLDTMTMLSALPPEVLEETHPVAAADYFGKNKLTTLLSEYFINALLIKRNKNDNGDNPIEVMDRLLKSGKSLIIFPEGSRGQPEEMQKFRKGIGILLEKNPDIPFIPVYLDGMGKALPKGEGLLVPFNGSIRIGKAQKKLENMSIEETASFVEKQVQLLNPLNSMSV